MKSNYCSEYGTFQALLLLQYKKNVTEYKGDIGIKYGSIYYNNKYKFKTNLNVQ